MSQGETKESEEVIRAAETLCALKHDYTNLTLSRTSITSQEEDEDAKENRTEIIATTSSSNPQSPRDVYSIDGTQLPYYPPLENLRGLIGTNSGPFEKQLTNSDVNKCQCRLTLGKRFAESSYLKMWDPSDRGLDEGIKVMVYGPGSREFEMEFKYWSSKVYVLIGGWRKLVEEYGLKAHTHWVRVWMFRHGRSGQLCFALTFTVVDEIERVGSLLGV